MKTFKIICQKCGEGKEPPFQDRPSKGGIKLSVDCDHNIVIQPAFSDNPEEIITPNHFFVTCLNCFNKEKIYIRLHGDPERNQGVFGDKF